MNGAVRPSSFRPPSPTFSNAATHDLRQPLYAAQLFADALLDEVGSLRQGELVEHLQSAIQAMSAQLELLLDVSRLDMGKLQIQSRAVAVRDIFQSGAIDHGPQAERVGGATEISHECADRAHRSGPDRTVTG